MPHERAARNIPEAIDKLNQPVEVPPKNRPEKGLVSFDLLFKQQEEEARKKRQKLEQYLKQEESESWYAPGQRAPGRGDHTVCHH